MKNEFENISIDGKSKLFFIALAAGIIFSLGFTFYKFFIAKDYDVKLEAGCEPEAENCFVYECDPAEDAGCPENLEERKSYYKIVEKKASAVPECDPNDPDCPLIACQAGEKDCREIYCDEKTKTEGEICSHPEEYLKSKSASDNEVIFEDGVILDSGVEFGSGDAQNAENEQINNKE